MDDLSADAARLPPRRGPRQPHRIRHGWPEPLRRAPGCQPRGQRREEIAAMERGGERARRQPGLDGVDDGVVRQEGREEPVVGPDEPASALVENQRTARAAHAACMRRAASAPKRGSTA